MLIAVVISLVAVLLVILLAVFPIRAHWFVRPKDGHVSQATPPRPRPRPVKKVHTPFRNSFIFQDEDDYDDKEL